MADDKNTSTFPMLGDASAKTASPTPAKPTQPKAEPEKEVKPVADKAKDPTGEFDYSKCKTYTVKDGQDLLDVANDVLVAYRQLRYFNHLDKTTMAIKPDQIIYIPNKPINVPVGK